MWVDRVGVTLIILTNRSSTLVLLTKLDQIGRKDEKLTVVADLT
jgi:hypothetical protein